MDPVAAVDLSGWYSDSKSSSRQVTSCLFTINDPQIATPLTYRAFSSNEILSTTFSNAKLQLRSITNPQDFESLFPSTSAQNISNHTLSDVQQRLEEARITYEARARRSTDIFRSVAPTTATTFSQDTLLSKAQTKACIWLMGLSEKILNYSNIFDVLVQNHPEYVSLAWGTFKLLFVVSCITCYIDILSLRFRMLLKIMSKLLLS